MIKKFLLPLMAGVVLFAGITAKADNNAQVYINDVELECEVPPVNINERVLVPMRAIFEALGAQVEWDGEKQMVWAYLDENIICLTINDEIMTTGIYNSDGARVLVDKVYLDVPAQLVGDYTYVPVRAVSEALRAEVSWDGENSSVIIDTRRDEEGWVYYSSDSDYQKLYAIGKNGKGRKKLSEKSVYGLEMYDGEVYYLSKDENYLYKVSADKGEECLLDTSVNKLGIEDDWLYYQELQGKEYGILYRMNLISGEVQQLIDRAVKYPQKYRNYIYFNLENDNNMYGLATDGSAINTINVDTSIGDSSVVCLYPFNCIFFGDYILVENGVWYGNIVRLNLDGSDVRTLNQTNSIIFRNQLAGDRIIFMNPTEGQDIYCMNIDGTEEKRVLQGNPLWLEVTLLAQYGDTIYYKNPMRGEVYRINLDGSGDEYICYADTVKIYGDRLFSSYQGLYIGNIDGSNMINIYDREVKDFEITEDVVYVTDAYSSKLYMIDFSGRKVAVTNESVGEWVCE